MQQATLLHFFLLTAFVAPLQSALMVAFKAKAGFTGFCLALVLGLVLSFGSSSGFYYLYFTQGRRILKIKSETAQNVAITAVFLSAFVWLFLSCFIPLRLMQLILS